MSKYKSTYPKNLITIMLRHTRKNIIGFPKYKKLKRPLIIPKNLIKI